jgi:ABC-type sugar transport system permease subunit
LLLSVPFALALPLGIAVLLHQRVAGWRIFRSIYFLPTAISWVVLGLVAERFFAYQGTLNSFTPWASLTSAPTCWAISPKPSSRSASRSSSR